MVQFSTYDRANRRDSPLFWLLVLAGSLVLHLAVLLLGRWYLTQPSRSQVAGGSSKAIEFVEVDPNAAISRNPPATGSAKLSGSTPSETSTKSSSPQASSPQSASPQRESSDPSSTASIGRFATPSAAVRLAEPSSKGSRPSPSPQPLETPIARPAQNGVPETPSTRPQSTPDLNQNQPRPSPPASVSPSVRPAPSGSQGLPTSPIPDPQTSPSPSDGAPSGENSSQPTSTPEPQPSAPAAPSGQPSPENDPSAPVGSGTTLPPTPNPLGGEVYQGQIVGQPTIPASARASDGGTSAKSATLVSPLQPFKADSALDLGGENVLELRVNFTIDNERKEFEEINQIEEDSPTLQKHPNLDRAVLKEIARNVLWGAKFDVVIDSTEGRIAPVSDWEILLRIDVTPAS